MPILPLTLSRKFFHATKKVEQFVDSVDAGVNDLEDKPKSSQNYNISNPQIAISIGQSSYVCTHTMETFERSQITDVQNNTIADDKMLLCSDLPVSLQNHEIPSVSNTSPNSLIKGQEKFLPVEAVSNDDLCLNSPSPFSRSYVCTSNNWQLPNCLETSSNNSSSEVPTSTGQHYFDSNYEQKTLHLLPGSSGNN